jgi:hypothetical protein
VDISVATIAELTDELLDREDFEGIVLKVDTTSPVRQAPAVAPAISATIALPRAVSLLQLVASRFENDPPSYPTYVHA